MAGPMGGPGPRGRMQGPRPKVKNPGKLLKRLFAIVLRSYAPHCILVLLCIACNAYVMVRSALFLERLMDDYIVPMVNTGSTDFGPLIGALTGMLGIYALGVLCSWGQNRLMINVSQGTMRELRTRVFEKMEALPISYFDTHAHGDIMSVYTNDIDTLRQMISQSMPQLISSTVTIVSVFITMLTRSIPLTILTCLMTMVTVLEISWGILWEIICRSVSMSLV